MPPRVPPLEYEDALPDARAQWDDQIARHGRMTNMKRTLARSPVALRTLMTWYDLLDEVRPFLGERAAMVFSHAVSAETDCLICSTFFRRILIERGENPDALETSPLEADLVAYGRAMARQGRGVPDDVFARLRAAFDESQLVALTAFGAMMAATNTINNALEVPLDDYLEPFRARA